MLVGFDKSDDAAVYKVSEEIALIQTLDFFTPMFKDKYIFGQVAAANALSDVYAMGGVPKTAMNILCFPEKGNLEELDEMLRGGADKIKEAGAVLSGGHSVNDPIIKYGLSVTGITHPNKVWKNYGSQEGDAIIITKPLGTGIVVSAMKLALATKDSVDEAVKYMTMLNKYSADVMRKYEITACTDITGFGFLGHLSEMAKPTSKTFIIESDKIPYLPGIKKYLAQNIKTGVAGRNKIFVEALTEYENVPLWLQEVMWDPQTAGGLLFTVPQKDLASLSSDFEKNNVEFWVIGRVENFSKNSIIVK